MGIGDIPLRVVVKQAIPVALLGQVVRPRSSSRRRVVAGVGLLGFWSLVYARYRRDGVRRTWHEFDLLQNTDEAVYKRHYDEQVVTVEEEYERWGPYDEHRHEMRYDVVAAAVREHLPPRGRILDLGCGGGTVAERLFSVDADYVGLEYGERNARHVMKKFADLEGALSTRFLRADAERLPFANGSFDVVVMSEVIEHLLRPDRATWEISRVLRAGGVLILTTNNASEMPCRSPLTHPLAYVEKALGATSPKLISYRPWVWPYPMDRELLAPGASDVYLPHTHHIFEETRQMFAAAGLDTKRWCTFEFPPPQSATAHGLARLGPLGRRAVDIVERIAARTPLVNRLGCHLMIEAIKVGDPISPRPLPGVWPGPLLQR
jgi:SAM-dependent methyltransferase